VSEIPKDIKEIDDRITAIKAKNINKVNKIPEKAEASPIVMVFQIAVEMVSGVFVGMGIGYILDEVFDFNYLFLLIFTIFGGMAGILNVSRYLSKQDESKKG